METFLAKTFQIPFHSLSFGGKEDFGDKFALIFFKKVTISYLLKILENNVPC